jgi:serine/threonine protein kinase
MHRDLKAENVLLVTAEDGQLGAKLADFGLHKVVRMPGKRQWSFADIK